MCSLTYWLGLRTGWHHRSLGGQGEVWASPLSRPGVLSPAPVLPGTVIISPFKKWFRTVRHIPKVRHFPRGHPKEVMTLHAYAIIVSVHTPACGAS